MHKLGCPLVELSVADSPDGVNQVIFMKVPRTLRHFQLKILTLWHRMLWHKTLCPNMGAIPSWGIMLGGTSLDIRSLAIKHLSCRV